MYILPNHTTKRRLSLCFYNNTAPIAYSEASGSKIMVLCSMVASRHVKSTKTIKATQNTIYAANTTTTINQY